jgi:6,7-dimethyl-8-ribityllumazine synthase
MAALRSKGKAPRLALVVSRFNEDVTGGLRGGALAFLKERGVPAPDAFEAPGAFEIPLIAKKLAASRRYDGVICLGCVIKGDTAHFEFISLGATIGLIQASLETEVPVTFGILTTYDEEQAVLRSQDNAANKGREAAAACLDALETLRRIESRKR